MLAEAFRVKLFSERPVYYRRSSVGAGLTGRAVSLPPFPTPVSGGPVVKNLGSLAPGATASTQTPGSSGTARWSGPCIPSTGHGLCAPPCQCPWPPSAAGLPMLGCALDQPGGSGFSLPQLQEEL